VRRLNSHPPTPGNELHLSIDIKLQNLEQLYGDRRGALVAIDPRNGEVLAFVSKPTFDPNLFVDGIDFDSWRELNESIDKPLLNRAARHLPAGLHLQALHGDGGAGHRQARPHWSSRTT
jgi:penicillin-binding protein 2